MKTNVKYLRSNEIEDIFSFTNEEKETEYIKFPRSMEMNINDVNDHLNI